MLAISLPKKSSQKFGLHVAHLLYEPVLEVDEFLVNVSELAVDRCELAVYGGELAVQICLEFLIHKSSFPLDFLGLPRKRLYSSIVSHQRQM